ncbi:MAG TPA: DUF2254 domain-containing protein [Tepidisphaeraceae bacterium]|nr:DUF2254 domain-containing protein [Tepidisphaeraceae bacterium]
MKARLSHIWEILTSSYWFIPALMLVGAAALAFGLLYLDERYPRSGWAAGWLYPGGIEGARSVLATVAASVITVAGVVFSITIATLTQASSQFGPRMLRNFMRDVGNQMVLGTFVATFVFCLLVLRSIGSEQDGTSVPHVSVMAAVVLALASIAVLIYFIHHVSLSLQAPIIVANVASDLEQALQRIFPSDLGHGPRGPGAESEEPPLPPEWSATPAIVPSPKDGYLQVVDQDTLMELVAKHDVVLRFDVRPGDYLIQGNPAMRVYPAERCSRRLVEELAALLIIGRQRTPEQDVEFAIHQLVEVAVRALSPGINDPYTALNCIDRLSSALVMIEKGDLHGSYRYDRSGRLRVVARVATFTSYVDASFNQIRQYGRGSAAVMVRMLDAIRAAAAQMRFESHRRDLLRHAEMLHRQARETLQEPHDLSDVTDRYAAAVDALKSAHHDDK